MSGIYNDPYGNELHGDGREVYEPKIEEQSMRKMTAREFFDKEWAHDTDYSCETADAIVEFAEAYSQSGAGLTAQDNAIEAANDRVAQHERDKPHGTVPVKVWADIDIEMSPHVAYLNTIEGLRTHASCQGMEHGPHPYEAYIMASWPEAAEAELRERYTIEPLGERWGYLHPIASKSGLLSGAGSPEETKPTKCQHGVNYPHECKDCIFAEGHCQLASHLGLHTETDDCMNWWVIARPTRNAVSLLVEFVRDVECYCSDNPKRICPVHEARALIEAGAASSSQGAEPTKYEPKECEGCEMCDPSFDEIADTNYSGVAESAPEPPSQPTCPKCGSTIRNIFRRPCDTENGTAHAWHSGAGGGSTGEPDWKALCKKAAKILLDHMNDADYEMSLAGVYAMLTEDELGEGASAPLGNTNIGCHENRDKFAGGAESKAEAQRAAGLRTIAKPGEPGYSDNLRDRAEHA